MQLRSGQEDLRALSERLFRSLDNSTRRGNVLEMRHATAPVFDPEFLHPAGLDSSLLVNLIKGSEPHSDQPVVCGTTRLPFQDSVFSMVLLHHVITDGMEPELDEAVRVLTRDGILVIVGLNRLGWRFRSQGQLRRLPGIAPLKLKSRLGQLDMITQGVAVAGFFGMKRPLFLRSALAGLCLSTADVVLLQARHNNGPEMTPLKFRKLASGIVQSA